MFKHIIASLLLASTAQAVEFTVAVDDSIQRVRVEWTGLQPYEQIELAGIGEFLFWCLCVDNENPRSLGSTGFSVNGLDLQIQYEGQPPPADNFIEYWYEDAYFIGFIDAEWVKVTFVDGEETSVTAPRPVIVPEPPIASGLVVGAAALASRSRRGELHGS